MKNIKFISLSLLFFGTMSHAQDLEQAKKAIDAEQYQQAKTILKTLIASKPDEGKNYFHLGDIYLTLNNIDSAKIYFDKGIMVKNDPQFNYIGLGEIELDKANAAGAQDNFTKATADMKRKDTDQFLYIGRAYTKSENPDYKKAAEYINKVIAIDSKSAQAYLSLGDAQFGDKNANGAFSSYRTAYDLDNTLIRAKMQLAVITKNAKSFPQAVKSFDEIVASNPNYGPVYRELAETYYFWGVSEPAKYNDYVKKALGYYEKYMSLTDYSLESRMRHADFLILAKDYKALEVEAQKMQQLDKVNPRILRYLGYSAYENKNYDASIKALSDYIAKADPKKITGSDYVYLAKAQLAQAISPEGEITNQAQFDKAIAELKKAVTTDPLISGDFSELGVNLYKQKLYSESAKVFELSTKNPKSKNYVLDNFYLGNSIFFDAANKATDAERAAMADKLILADSAYAIVTEAAPTTQDAHANKAKVNRFINTPESKAKAVASYEEYINVVTTKGAEETAKAGVKSNLIEAYSFLGSYYSETDKAKAIQNFEKALALEPGNKYFTQSLQVLRK